MGIGYYTYCIDCPAEAPWIGDAGTIGWPTLGMEYAPGKVFTDSAGGKHRDDPYFPFGRLYRGLAAINLITSDIAAYHAFLVAHDGHRVVLTSDLDDDCPDFDLKAATRFELDDSGFVNAEWQVTCVETGDTFEVGWYDFAPFEERTLTAEEVATFCHFGSEYVKKAITNHPPGSVDPEDVIAPLVRFFRENKGNTFGVRLAEEINILFD